LAKEKKKRNNLTKIIVFLVLFGPGTVIVLMAFNQCENHFEGLPNFGEMPKYEFIDINGKTINNESQKDRITVFHTLQTSCPRDCAIDLFKFNLILYQDLIENRDIFRDVDIITIVTDNEGNVTEDLEVLEYTLNDILDNYDPTLWYLVTGDPKQVYDIENNDINLYDAKVEDGYAGKAYLETLLLVDKENNLRLARRGNVEGYIRDFKQNVSLLNQTYKDLEKANKNEKK